MHAAQHIKSPILHETDLLLGTQSLRQISGRRSSDGCDCAKAISATAPDSSRTGGEISDPRMDREAQLRPLLFWSLLSVDSIDRRMQSFVQWRGEVPPEAKRLEDFEARGHTAPWVRFNIGEGIVASYVVGFQHGDGWWTYFFERIEREDAPGGAERWRIEAYNSQGRSWTDDFLCWPLEHRWSRALPTSASGSIGTQAEAS
jgi:hypothetical protein